MAYTLCVVHRMVLMVIMEGILTYILEGAISVNEIRSVLYSFQYIIEVEPKDSNNGTSQSQALVNFENTYARNLSTNATIEDMVIGETFYYGKRKETSSPWSDDRWQMCHHSAVTVGIRYRNR